MPLHRLWLFVLSIWDQSFHPAYLVTLTKGRGGLKQLKICLPIFSAMVHLLAVTLSDQTWSYTSKPFSPQTSAEIFSTHEYCMNVRTVKWHLQLQWGVTKMSRGTFCDCVSSKYSVLLSVLHFKPFHAAALLSIFTLVSIERAACGFKIE